MGVDGRRPGPRGTVVNGIELTKYVALACQWAIKYGARHPVEDSEQYADAWIGLVKAAERFDHARGIQFTTYATWWLRQSVSYPLNRAKCQKREGLSRTMAFSQHGHDPDFADVLAGEIVDHRTDDPVAVAAAVEERERLGELMACLFPRQRDVIRSRFFEHRSLADIAAAEGVSKERIRQIELRALERMREHADRIGLDLGDVIS